MAPMDTLSTARAQGERLCQALVRLPHGAATRIAKAVGISRNSMSAMKLGKQTLAGHERALAAALGVPPQWLAEGTGPLPSWLDHEPHPMPDQGQTTALLERIAGTLERLDERLGSLDAVPALIEQISAMRWQVEGQAQRVNRLREKVLTTRRVRREGVG